MSRGPWHTRKQIRRGKARGRAGDGPPPDAAPPCGRVRWRDRGPTKQPPRLFSQQAAARRPRSPPTRPHVSSVSPIGRGEVRHLRLRLRLAMERSLDSSYSSVKDVTYRFGASMILGFSCRARFSTSSLWVRELGIHHCS